MPSQAQTPEKVAREERQRKRAEARTAEAEKAPAVEDHTILENTDDLLGDIDALLEDVSELVNYRQKGGE